jgi:queuine/archaeosine tRNA-ribosyltransferase
MLAHHNLAFLLRLEREVRAQIRGGTMRAFAEAFTKEYGPDAGVMA